MKTHTATTSSVTAASRELACELLEGDTKAQPWLRDAACVIKDLADKLDEAIRASAIAGTALLIATKYFNAGHLTPAERDVFRQATDLGVRLAVMRVQCPHPEECDRPFDEQPPAAGPAS